MTSPETDSKPTIDGAALLDQVERFHRRFNVFPREAAYVAVTLWDAHAHLIGAFDSTPRIAFLSPEPGSGKSRALEIVETLVPNRLVAAHASANAMYRAVGDTDKLPTVLFDEVDTIFGPKAGDNEPLRGFLNAGHRRGVGVLRCVGDGSNQEAHEFQTFCAVALAGLGSLPDTILTRSIIIRMRKRAPNEKVEPYRQRIHEKQGNALRDQLARWAHQVREQVEGAWPTLPDGISDRPADVWEPLLAVADAAGGHWPDRARAACIELVTAAKEDDKASIGVQLLTDLRDKAFCGADRMPTAAILECLTAIDEAPWGDMDGNGKALTSRVLSKMLGEYVTWENKPIRPRSIRTAGGVPKGYYAEDLADAWTRYCPPPPQKSATSATPATQQVSTGADVAEELPGIRYITDRTATPARTA
ncbi:DUF3631 domain-containing protein [Streptomyces sp. ME19-01-6]|uniref:DUF3631 domain-containing protein n=1 Tax=Streptomyces sp. ME19-01-6 TaxID=3028686 RepID=UPI0029A4BCF3|nr:DUF3631 domain-containing protein [Streptomyces sp. ME19-01-6]MDX3226093.1 DUF3631 domain-containing protein [Streptomyces sp. ME19-01-6]